MINYHDLKNIYFHPYNMINLYSNHRDIYAYLSSQMDQTVVNGSVAAAVDNGTTGGASGSVSGTNWTTAVSDLTPVLSPFESWQKVIIVLVIGVCMVLTITGNILVLVSFIVDRTIRQPSNYFIASLAATDMLIGRVNMRSEK